MNHAPARPLDPLLHPTWRTLAAALRDVDPPCRADPPLWTDPTTEADVDRAAAGCRRCPVRQPCAEYADAADEPCGIWAGIDRAALTKARRKAG